MVQPAKATASPAKDSSQPRKVGEHADEALSRLFFAIPVPLSVAKRLATIELEYPAAQRAGWRWVAPQQFHLTLAFLGHRTEQDLANILSAGLAAARAFSPFSLSCGKLGTFPKGRMPPNVLWAGVNESAPLRLLVKMLTAGLDRGSIQVDKKPFRAHITLARRRARCDVGPVPGLDLSGMAGGRWTVGELILMESHPTRGRPVYRNRMTWQLGS